MQPKRTEVRIEPRNEKEGIDSHVYAHTITVNIHLIEDFNSSVVTPAFFDHILDYCTKVMCSTNPLFLRANCCIVFNSFLTAVYS